MFASNGVVEGMIGNLPFFPLFNAAKEKALERERVAYLSVCEIINLLNFSVFTTRERNQDRQFTFHMFLHKTYLYLYLRHKIHEVLKQIMENN